ncbi:MAG: hypothetical protein QME62_04440, partial [Armatimonadota bacterium]|nr:hypothetical protein [Armatimonadota bacterium]
DLDGGSSAALYYKGRIISSPSRKLTNILVIYDSIESYLAHRHALAPGLDTPVLETETVAFKPHSQKNTPPAPIQTKLNVSRDNAMPSAKSPWLTTNKEYFITNRW